MRAGHIIVFEGNMFTVFKLLTSAGTYTANQFEPTWNKVLFVQLQ